MIKKLFENRREKQPDLSQMNKAQLIELGKTTLTDQDSQIDNLLDTVNHIGTLGKTIGNELETDIQIMGRIEEGTDKNVNKMNKTQQKLSNFLKRTSNCCLLTIVAVEILIFIFLLTIL